ncbi:aspartyl/asparaginyl beta-hydroxylase domain-containing protein [Amycolatopsis rubida]|uniref:Aspartate beta-hydroxylase n=1 Tax=Amycolatopsis rubida TaxID=112413 RepID=A0A1I6AJ39_9PSEU|nr:MULTISPECIES: aspartyl/asparaginyl beta-hydroxylase domain-containing protein [Amycolatopsis]MYW90024.1 aspartyl/asparaginyl beta-hydroxylase domain-containing protein [Amycolatopsis rubida]NEC55001.1 aspartyl/asparaginyl beta-hydroxylase domain-containing protein [Amycolatopsis rubida]OAP20589.1 Aspartyl/Asparaginyl beta-hydroxylase [Amycolatopsis sp. M39]SFQ68700.1 aspartate beta-hydroxylase [Amycolatopsis rubida]
MRPVTGARRGNATRQLYSDLIAALLAEGDEPAARACAELAVAQGVWRHPAQRPVHYVPSLPPIPVYDPGQFWFTAYLRESYPRIRAELDTVTDPAARGFLPVEEPLLGKGRWEQVTFYEAGHRFADACDRFPVTASVIEGIPEASSGGPGVVTLSWLHPGAHIRPHCGGSNARQRVHLGLVVPEGPRIRVGDRVLRWREGDCLVFDDSFEHEVWHEGTEPRVVLLLDVSHADLDESVRDWILSARTAFDDRIKAYMGERGIERAELVEGVLRLTADSGAASLVTRHLREVDASAVELKDGKVRYE